MNRDFTSQIKYRTITFLILNIYLAIAAYFVSSNMYLGIFINVITIFVVTYVYMNDYRNPTSYIFLMNYIFMMTMKIDFNQLPTRILAVCTGVIIIIISQLLLNKNKFEKKSNKVIQNIIKEILDVIDDLMNDNYDEIQSIAINKKIRNLITYINNKSNKNSKKNVYELSQFNIAICLARLNVIITHVYRHKADRNKKNNYLYSLKTQIINISRYNEGLEDEDDINKQIKEFSIKYEELSKRIKFVDESIYVLKIFAKSISFKEEVDNTVLNKIYTNVNIPKSFNILEAMKVNFNINSLRFRYSLRLSLALSFVVFIAEIMNIKHQSWIILSAYVVLQPYKEQAIIKARQRFIGGTIGAVIFFITFSIIKDLLNFKVVTFLAFIGYFYFTEYEKQVIMITIISLGTISLVENLDKISIGRFIFVSIGIIVGLVFNQFVLPYNRKDSIEELKDKYIKNKNNIVKELNLILEGKKNLEQLMNLCIERNKIENNLILNSNKLNSIDLDKFMYEQNMEMSDEKYILLEHFYKIGLELK